MERTGWSLTNHVAECILESWLVSDHPVCGAKVGFAEILLMPQPPLLTRRGICLLEQFIHALFNRFTLSLTAGESLPRIEPAQA